MTCLIASKVTRQFSTSMFQTTHWSAPRAVSRAGRLRGYIAPTFGTIAGGRSNLAAFRSSFAAITNEEGVPASAASFVSKPISHYLRLNDAASGAARANSVMPRYRFAFRHRAGVCVFYYSALIPAALMIGHHFSISAFCCAASPSGVCLSRGQGSCPSSMNL